MLMAIIMLPCCRKHCNHEIVGIFEAPCRKKGSTPFLWTFSSESRRLTSLKKNPLSLKKAREKVLKYVISADALEKNHLQKRDQDQLGIGAFGGYASQALLLFQ